MAYVAPPPVSSLTRSTTVCSPSVVGVHGDRAEPLGLLQPGLGQVDGDDRAAGRGRGDHRRQADRAAPEDDQAVAGLGPQQVEHGAGAGLEAAAVRRQLAEVERLVDDDAVVGVRDGVPSEAGLAEEGAVDGLAVALVGGGAVHPEAHVVEHQRVLAVADGALQAGRAGAAGAEAHQHVVAHLDAADAGTDLLHDPGALVAEHPREHLGGQAVAQREVGVAQAGGDDPDQYLVVAGLVEVDLLEAELPALLVDDHRRGPHASRSSQK